MRRYGFYIISVFLFLILSVTAYATTYYVDFENGNDSFRGTSESEAWRTISKVNSQTFQAGNVVLLKRGGKWREQLNIKNSGSAGSPVTVGSYGSGDKPVISGADLLTGFELHSGNVWKKSSASPRQVFFSNIRGKQKLSIGDLTEERDWYFNSGILYVRSASDPASAFSIEAAVRQNAINVNAKNIIIQDIQVEKTFNETVIVSSNSENVIIDNLDFIQWTNEITALRGGIKMTGKNCILKNSTFGRNTGKDIEDQNWAGYTAVVAGGINPEVVNNKVYHTSLENEDPNGKYAYGIRILSAGGIIKVHGNTVYHTGSNGIFADTKTKAGDEIHIYNNTVSYAGQAGISLYKTRGSDGIGGTGYVYKNNVSYSNRLGGELGGGGNRAAGIHFNDGVQSGVSLSQPYMKWYCYENVVYSSQSLNERNSPDSDGIAVDYNANGVEVYKNLVYDCDGKGIYIWNADNCKIYYNIVYGNDCGITVTALGKNGETTDNNDIFNNVFYKNYNGDGRGKNYDTEIYFGQNGRNNKFVNNILYASSKGHAYLYNTTNTSGCFVDYNLVYSEGGLNAPVGLDSDKGSQTFTRWRSNHTNWDKNSINADPLFKSPESFDFRLKPGSPAINRGITMGLLSDFIGLPVIGAPDLGAFEVPNLINKVKIRTFLQGAYINGSMHTQLTSLNIIPASNPYNTSPWNYMGTENIATSQPDIVDWVLVELRSGLGSSTKAAQKALLLRNDGCIVDISGSEEVEFGDLSGSEYYIIIYHRNHLPVMSASPVNLTAESPSYDFTTSASKAFGNEAMVQLQDNIFAMPSGDSDANGIIDDSDFADVGNRIFQNGYQNADLDLNHVINILDYGKSGCNMNRSSQIPE
ncbi:MAG: right-handed parallel beta-helix repeat-containing protein [Ignavibacteriaceae bacterium]